MLDLLVGDPGIENSVVTSLKPEDDVEAEFETDDVAGLAGAAATNGEALVVYQDY